MPDIIDTLIVDDEPDLCELIGLTLNKMNLSSQSVFTLNDAKAILREKKFLFCLTDMQLPDGNGLDLVKYIQTQYPKVPVAVITAHANIESAIVALKNGAFDFVSKPIDITMLRNLVNTALKLSTPRNFTNTSSELILIGKSQGIQQLHHLIQKVSRSQAPVYISGESGVGKELVAKLIHQTSPRAEGPFIPVNCGAMVPTLVESELFGHIKGSFTGATQNKIGLFQAAHQGTLFLDEVAELPLDIQVKLLRAIQEKAIRPVGSNQENLVDVRILCATNHPLLSLVQQGKFRQDLYYRLNVIELRVPPLRERIEDLPFLIEQFLSRFSTEPDQKIKLSQAALAHLQQYSFPGNVRELENILERAATLKSGPCIEITDLQIPILSEPNTQPVDEANNKLEQEEKKLIIDALEKTNGNITQAAKLLGITFRTLRYRMNKHGIQKS